MPAGTIGRMRVPVRRLSVGGAAVILLSSLALGQGAVMASTPTPSSGYNNWSCVPSASHPQPVVLLHGLGATSYEDLATEVAPYLEGHGYCVYGSTYGATSPFGSYFGGLGDITASGKQIAGFIEKVLAATHATKVDLVGHSEGAFMSLWVPKEDGLAKNINTVVAIAPPTHGTTFGGLVTLGQDFSIIPEVDDILDLGCVACGQIIIGGTAVRTLDQGPIAQHGVSYTVIASKTDELVTPTSTAFVQEPYVTNEYVQTTCPDDPVGHLGEAFDSDIEQMITNALDPKTAQPITCSIGPPF